MEMRPWHYFLSLEKEFMRSLDFVEADQENYKTFSNAFARMILLVGSEVDIVAKLLCQNLNSSSKASKICDYQREIVSEFSGIDKIEIEIPQYKLVLKPWGSWVDAHHCSSPDWWKAYNEVKHDRNAAFARANLENVLLSLAGLLSLHLYYYREHPYLEPFPIIFEYGFPQILTGEGNTKPLPGYRKEGVPRL